MFLKPKIGEANFVRSFSRPSEVVGTSYLVGLVLYTCLSKKKFGSSKFSVFIFFLMVIGFLVCVCGGTEIAGILVCSTFAEALGQELAVKIHRTFGKN